MYLQLSDHAHLRASQRNVSYEDILFITEHGNRVRRTGVIFCQMRRKDLPDELDNIYFDYERLIGTTVVLCGCGYCAVTVYREEEAFKKDRRKSKYNFLKDTQRIRCPYCQPSNDRLQ